MLFKEKLSRYYGVSKNNKCIHPDTLINYIYDISGFNKLYLDNITEELSEERFIEFVKVLLPQLDSLELIDNIDPTKFILEYGYVAGSRLLKMQDPELGIAESINRAKEIEFENSKLDRMTIELSYTGDVNETDGFGIASYEVKMNNGSIIRFDFMNVSIYIDKGDEGIAIITCDTIDTGTFPESANIGIYDIAEITDIEFEDDGDYVNINQIESITMYSNAGKPLELKPWQLVNINNKLSSH